MKLKKQEDETAKYLILENDVIELLYNGMLKNKPYLLRFCNFNNEIYEIRLDKSDIKFINNFLNGYLEN